ncbi:MAG: hypothetical protein ACI4EG_00930 [Fusicatenibacter sp.]
MKRNWERPSVMVQEFEANEYVAACWYVACNWEAANAVEKTMSPTNPNNNGRNNYTDGQTHDAAHCGTSGNQVIVTNSSNVATGMYEINSTTGVKELTCTLYTDASYKTSMAYSSVEIGDTIYWTTNLTNGTTWYHQGLVNGVNNAHPNRS